MSHASAPDQKGHYFVPAGSHYSTTLSTGIFLMALGLILKVNGVANGWWSSLFGAAMVIYVLFGWFGEVIAENRSGVYTRWEDRSYRIGMVWFIFSEVMFFACFFGTLWYVRRIVLPELAGYEADLTPYKGFTAAWPNSGPMGDPFTPMGAWGVPAINTLLLLTSGVTLTWAHWGLIKNKRSQLNLGIGYALASARIANAKGRDIECPGTGACYLTTYHWELAEMFEIGKEVLCYRNVEELIELHSYYGKRPDACLAIARAAHRRAHAEHTWEMRLRALVRDLGLNPIR